MARLGQPIMDVDADMDTGAKSGYTGLGGHGLTNGCDTGKMGRIELAVVVAKKCQL